MTTKNELNEKLAKLQEEIELTQKELTKIEINEKINICESEEIKPLIVKLTSLYKKYDLPFELKWTDKPTSVIVFNTFNLREQEYFDYNTLEELKTWFEKQIFLTKIYKELFKNFIGKDVSYLHETDIKNTFTFRARDYDFILELRSNKKVKSLKVLYSNWSDHIQMLFDHYGMKLEIEGDINEDSCYSKYKEGFIVNISTEKENFNLSVLSDVINELVDKLEGFPKIEFRG